MPSRIKDSNHLLDITDNINSMFLPTDTVLVNFDIVNMFPKIDNKSSGMRQKGESQNGCFKKAKHAKMSEKQTFLTP